MDVMAAPFSGSVDAPAEKRFPVVFFAVQPQRVQLDEPSKALLSTSCAVVVRV